MYVSQVRNIFESQTTYSLRPGILQRGAVTCSILIGASIHILIARTLGPEALGSYLFVQWLATILVPLLSAGASSYTSGRIAAIQSHESPRLVAGIFYFLWYRQHRSMLLYSFLYLLISFPLARLFHDFTPTLLLLASLSILPLLLSNVAGTTLRSQRRTDLLVMIHLFGALLTLLLIMIAMQIAEKAVAALLLAFALASTMTLILAVICVTRLLPLEKALRPGIFLKERLERSLNLSWLTFTVDAIVWQRSELLLLACCQSPAELGFYALSAIISMNFIGLAPTLFSYGLLSLLLRWLPRYRHLNTYDAFLKTTCLVALLAIVMCTLLMLFCPEAIRYCLGVAYLPMVKPLRILLVAATFGSIATVSLPHLAQREPQPTQHQLHAVVALAKIMLAIPFISWWGITGAALASALSQSASAAISIVFCFTLLKHCSINSRTEALTDRSEPVPS